MNPVLIRFTNATADRPGFLVDAEDVHRVVARRWHWRAVRGYVSAVSNTTRTSVYAHRQVLGLKIGDKSRVTHINGDPLDNRRSNLRVTKGGVA